MKRIWVSGASHCNTTRVFAVKYKRAGIIDQVKTNHWSKFNLIFDLRKTKSTTYQQNVGKNTVWIAYGKHHHNVKYTEGKKKNPMNNCLKFWKKNGWFKNQIPHFNRKGSRKLWPASSEIVHLMHASQLQMIVNFPLVCPPNKASHAMELWQLWIIFNFWMLIWRPNKSMRQFQKHAYAKWITTTKASNMNWAETMRT